jgi:hypothetical protein
VICKSNVHNLQPNASPSSLVANSQNTTCVCASTVYVTNLTQCATSSCSFSASDIKGFLNSGCPNGACAFVSELWRDPSDANVSPRFSFCDSPEFS